MKGSFEKGKNTITNAKKRDLILQFYTTCKQLEGNENKTIAKGKNLKLSYILYYMHERLNDYC
jgi:hypothetical protein